MDEMNKRGDKHMGFDHLKTTHHFLLSKDGGAIQVAANDPKDTAERRRRAFGDRRRLRADGISLTLGRLKQFDRIPVRIFQLDLLPTWTNFHFVSKA